MTEFDLELVDGGTCHMSFEIRAWGKTHRVSCEYDDDVSWKEIVNDVVHQLEASFGYSIDVSKAESIGIYYPGKHDE